MICEQCKEEGKKSKVYVGLTKKTTITWIPYYDEEGRYVNADPNVTTTEYACTNGHDFQEVRSAIGLPL